MFCKEREERWWGLREGRRGRTGKKRVKKGKKGERWSREGRKKKKYVHVILPSHHGIPLVLFCYYFGFSYGILPKHDI